MQRVLITIFLLIYFQVQMSGQTIPANSYLEKKLRDIQLEGQLDSALSFAVRPIRVTDTLVARLLNAGKEETLQFNKNLFTAKNKRIRAGVLPMVINQQYNNHHPYGWNDGSMIPAKGYQVQVSAGIYATAGPLEVQFKPEFVFAANSSYPFNSLYGSSQGKSYQKIFAGQSHVQLSAFSVSIGLSTENIWWGPGVRSSLLMSNNAPGFLHGYVRSNKPLKTFVGNFEWQVIGAKLTSDMSRPYDIQHLRNVAISGRSRYLNAFVLSYNPKWTPGMFLGVTRALQRSVSDIGLTGSSLFNKYLPILFKPVQKINTLGDDTLRTDQLASFFMRWVFLKAKAEFYVEYGFNDYGINARDYLMGTSHSAAYLVGIRKVVSRPQNKKIVLGAELTQMSQSPDWLVRNSGNWYVHGEILEGYTHQNQILGSGAGLGTNVFSLDATWVNGWKQLGFLFERIDRDPQYHINKWIDIGLGVLPQWKYKQFLVSGLFEIIHTNNYLWEKGKSVLNVHTRLSVNYQF